jgi:hypothetical protein
MPSPQISHALLAPEPQKDLPLPMAAQILGAIWQVDTLIELADRVCDPIFRRSIEKTTTDAAVAYRSESVRRIETGT